MAASNACWGIEIGAGAIKALKLESTSDGVQVVEYAVINHPRVLSEPEIDPDDAKRVALGRLVNEFDLSGATIAVSIPGHSAFARFAKLPPVEPKKVPDIVKFEAVQQIPFPLEEVEWDYQTFVSPDSPDVEVGIFAVTRDRIMQDLTLMNEVGLTPDVVTLSPVAVYNALAYDLEFTESTPGTVLLDIGTTATDLIVAEAGRVWIRTFPMGGHEFTNALVDAFKLSYSKADRLKRDAERSKHARHVFQALRPVFTDLAQDVQRSIGYYQSLHREGDLQRVIGVGSTFQLPGLRKYLKQQLGMNVYRLERFKRVGIEGARAAEFEPLSLNLTTAYGLALQGLGMATLEANIMPVGVIREAMWHKKAKWFLTAAGLGMAAGAAMFVRPFLDANAVSSVSPDASIQQAINLSDTLSSEARNLGVTEPIAGNFAAANVIESLKGRQVFPWLVSDVGSMVEVASSGESDFELVAMNTEYLFAKSAGDQPAPVDDFAGVGLDRGREQFAPDNAGAGRGPQRGPMPTGGRRDPRAQGGFEEPGLGGPPAEGEPRLRVELELRTNAASQDLIVELPDTIGKWLRENADRAGVPYVLRGEEPGVNAWTIEFAGADPSAPGRSDSSAFSSSARERSPRDARAILEEQRARRTGAGAPDDLPLPAGGVIIGAGSGVEPTQAEQREQAQRANSAQELERIAPLNPPDDDESDAMLTTVRVVFEAVLRPDRPAGNGGDA